MKLSLFEQRTVTSQEEMINITKGANIERYCKTGYSKIRLAVPGEKVTTIVNGQEETTNTAKEGDCVIEGPEKELYIVSEDKVKERYTVDSDITSSFKKFQATGKSRGYQYVGPTFYFTAPWGEKTVCENGDYLMSNPTGKIDEVYRVAKIVFDKMWSVQKKDVEDVD